MDFFVIRMIYLYQILIPGLFPLLIVTPHKFHQSLLDYFCFPICLCMECCRPLHICVNIFSHNVVQNVLRNHVFIFEMILLGILKCTQTYPKKKIVASCPLMVFLQGMIMHILLNLSTTTNYY